MQRNIRSIYRANNNRVLDLVRDFSLLTAERLNCYRHYTDQESYWRKSERRVEFEGEAPHASGRSHQQVAIAYAHPRSQFEFCENVYYDSAGMAWVNGELQRKYSIRQPGPKDFFRRMMHGPHQCKKIRQGTIVESSTPMTYGDWFAGILRSLVNVDPRDIAQPIILPECLGEKHYVQRDLKALGIHYVVSHPGILIENCTVLRQLNPLYELSREDVFAYRRAFAISPRQPRSGSVLYLARYNMKSEAKDRTYPSKFVAEFVRQIGGGVLDTRFASPQKFDELAQQAETVIADQGSAIFGLIHWQTKRVLELTQDNWWNNANVFLAKACGVERYRVAVVDNATHGKLEHEIQEILMNTDTKTGDPALH